MKSGSRIALAAAAGIAAATSFAPAAAKKADQAAQPPALKLSDAVRKSAVAAQTAIAAKDYPTAETSIAAVEAAAKNDDERYLAQTLRLNVAIAQVNAMPDASRNDTTLAAPLDALIANPSTPKVDLPKYLNARAGISYSGKQYAVAVQFWTRARDLGYHDDNLALNIARAKMEAGDITGGAGDMEAAVAAETAAGRKAPEAWYRYVIARLYKANAADATDAWTRNWLAAYGTKENWRDAIIAFGFQGPGVTRLTDRQRVDLYRLMRATNSLGGQKEYIDYADASNKIGLPTEAKTVIQDGLDSKIIPAANMTALDLRKQAGEEIAADKPLATQEKLAAASPKGELSAQAADAYLGLRDTGKAISLYQAALAKGVADPDPVNLHLGIALAESGNKDEAKATLAKVAKAPNTAIAKLWTTYLVSPPAA